MYIMSGDGNAIINSVFVERFIVSYEQDCVRITASYGDDRRLVTLERYQDKQEAKDAMEDLMRALAAGTQGFFYMPASRLYHEEQKIYDSKQTRKGGSGNHKGRRS